MIISYFKYYFLFFDINGHLPVPFVKVGSGGSFVDHLHFFCLHRITCLSIPTVTQA